MAPSLKSGKDVARGFPALSHELFLNAQFQGGAPYTTEEREIVSLEAHRAAVAEITNWPGYAPTPLLSLSGLAGESALGVIHYKDEGERFGLGSFKALGGAYAVLRTLQRVVAEHGRTPPSFGALMAGRHRDITETITVTTATDGNHGRSVAWGAGLFGCHAVIYLPELCSAAREQAIAQLGAEVVRTARSYDGAVEQCFRAAEAEGRIPIPDTSVDGATDAPRDVMQGYTVMVEEAYYQIGDGDFPTHIFVQGGVGALAAAVCGYLAERFAHAAPRVVVVEPDGAACLYESAKARRPVALTGDVHSVMAGLNCGTASPLAWAILARRAFAFLTISDDATALAMRLLADPPQGDPPIVAGESGVAGLAGAFCVSRDPAMRAKLELAANSRVLVFGTEGATDPEIYQAMVGRPPASVREARSNGS